MDVNMPIMDGYEATRLIKQRDPKQKIFIITAFTTEQDIRNSFSAGAEEHLSKPVTKKALKDVLVKHKIN